MQFRLEKVIFRSYLSFLMLVCVSVMALIVAVNRLVDPYGFYHAPHYEGFNINKPEIVTHLRLAKASAVKRIMPRSIILGSSRSEYGIDPEHPGWLKLPTYNLALSGGNIYEAMRYLQHAHTIKPLQEVVLMVDFFMFNALNNPNEIDFKENHLSVGVDGVKQISLISDELASLISLDTFFSSMNTVIKQGNKYESMYMPNGMIKRENREQTIKKVGGHRNAFISNERGAYASTHGKYSFSDKDINNIDVYRSLLKFCYQQDIHLNIAISPMQ